MAYTLFEFDNVLLKGHRVSQRLDAKISNERHLLSYFCARIPIVVLGSNAQDYFDQCV